MIIACPHCGTSYAVEAHDFGRRERSVECSACGERWLQAPDEPIPATTATASSGGSAGESSGTDRDVSVAQPSSGGTAGASPPHELLAHESASDAPSSQASGNSQPTAPPESDDLSAIAAESAGEDRNAALEAAQSETVPARHPPVSMAQSPTGATAKTSPVTPPGGREMAPLQALQRMRKQLIVGGIAAAAALCTLGALAIVLRGPLVAMLPDTAGVYDSIGLAPDPIGDGLEIRDVTSTRARESGEDVLTVRGVVANVSDSERPLPSLRVSLWNASDEEVQSATLNEAKGRLAPGEAIPFESRLPQPPPEARSLRVGFAQPES